jgi:glycosyltransferase involved in cell wall biosynthesis
MSDDVAQEPPGAINPCDARALTPIEIREAVLRREIAQLIRDRNRLADQVAALGQQIQALGGQPKLPVKPLPVAPGFVDSVELRGLRESVVAKDALITAMFHSTSWRLTAPLRRLSSKLGRGANTDLRSAIARTNRSVDPEAVIGVVTPDGPETAVHSPLPEPAFALASRVRRVPVAGNRGVVLVVADYLPLHDQQSGGLRLKTLVGLIIGLGWDVVFCSYLAAESSPGPLSTPDGIARYETTLRELGVSRFVYGIEPLRAFLAKAGGGVRHALVSFPNVAIELVPIIRLHCPWTRVIFDTVDFHYLRMSREATLRQDAVLQQEAEAMLVLELACVRMADVTLAVTPEERLSLLTFAPDSVVEVLPNVFGQPAEPPGVAGRRDILFVGGFWHKPNGDAVSWFVETIWPRLRAELPDLNFRIVGANPTEEILALNRQPGIEVLGYVPDLTQYQDAARVFVAPLRYGAGMKGKVGQSLAHGLPVVATPVGAEGMGLEDGIHLLVAEDPEAFAAQVLRLLRDDELWNRLQTEGRSLIEATLSERVVAARLDGLLRV